MAVTAEADFPGYLINLLVRSELLETSGLRVRGASACVELRKPPMSADGFQKYQKLKKNKDRPVWLDKGNLYSIISRHLQLQDILSMVCGRR